MKIQETQISAKGDNTIYVAFNDIEHIKEIHRQMAECGNSDLSTRNVIPPGYFDRFMALKAACSEERQKYLDLKTQIRFGEKDVEVLVKVRIY